MSYDLSAIKVEHIQSSSTHAWDAYVRSHPRATLYHLCGWKDVIEKTYGHRTYYLIATEHKPELMARNDKKGKGDELNANPVVGILPLVHIKSLIFGNNLISMPFLDYGGILADDQTAEKALLLEGINLAQELGVKRIELRHIEPLPWINEINSMSPTNPSGALTSVTSSHKVRMVLELPESSEELIKSFKSKLRSQIRKPIREGCSGAVAHLELLNPFYEVFSANMRDLGSPVHSKRLIRNVLNEFPHHARICVAFKDRKALAGSIVIGFKDTLENPWASSLKEFGRLSPNMLLYWTMLEYACNNGYRYFDFGRSSIHEGTYKFKDQWGGKPMALHWHYISVDGHPIDMERSEKSKFEKGIKIWQKLPIPVTKILGPRIRKHIGL